LRQSRERRQQQALEKWRWRGPQQRDHRPMVVGERKRVEDPARLRKAVLAQLAGAREAGHLFQELLQRRGRARLALDVSHLGRSITERMAGAGWYDDRLPRARRAPLAA